MARNYTFTHIIKIYKNIGDLSQQRLHWISYVDEYGPTLHYIEGPTNIIADIFSQLMRKDSPASLVMGKNVPVNGNKEESDNLLENYFSWTDDRDLLDCFMNLPKEEFFLTFQLIWSTIIPWIWRI